MSERENVLEPVEVEVEVEVSTLQEREQRERTARKQIERDSEIDWRSYERHTAPSRWKVY